MPKKAITEYWAEYYVHPTLHLCSLCGNSGIIDTRLTAISGAGYNSGMKNFCICPNGQYKRKITKNAAPI
jgi:hypothetical protein